MTATGTSATAGTTGHDDTAQRRRRTRRRTIIMLIILSFHVLGLLSALNAIMTVRTPQGAIAWSVALVTFPYVSVPAYWVFGRNRFRGYVQGRQTDEQSITHLALQVDEAVTPYVLADELRRANDAGRAAERVADLPFLGGNEAQLLIDGEATFASILEGIDQAREYVLFQFFIVHDDEIGREVKARLMAAARRGVRVYFQYDEVGSLRLPSSYKDALRHAGVHISAFNSRRGPGNRFQINFRNHRKVVVVDGRVAWVGGHNIGDEYLGRDPAFGRWRDTHVRFAGPAVLGTQISFAEDWHWATGEVLDLDWTPRPSLAGNQYMLVVPTGPADDLETMNLMFVHAINTANDRIWIASPYFVPDRAILVALQLAGLRGVDVRILIPERPDHLLVYLAAFSYFEEAARTGVKFYRYGAGFMHQKVVLLDDLVAAVGTANFDNRSFRLNFEITAVSLDSAFIADVEAMLAQDFAQSRQMDASDLEHRSFWFRLGVRLARLTAPIQ